MEMGDDRVVAVLYYVHIEVVAFAAVVDNTYLLVDEEQHYSNSAVDWDSVDTSNEELVAADTLDFGVVVEAWVEEEGVYLACPFYRFVAVLH